MGAIFDALFDELENAAHRAVVGANLDLKNDLIGRAPVDDGEVKAGIRVLKKPGRHGDVIESSVYVTGTQQLSRGAGRKQTEVPNQLVANATNKRTGWANGAQDAWTGYVQKWMSTDG